MREKSLKGQLADLLHEHYYPTMHEAIADSTLFDCADQILALITERTKKSLLTDEEIIDLVRLEFGEEFKITVNLASLDLEDEMVYYLDVLRYIAQAQLDKILKALE